MEPWRSPIEVEVWWPSDVDEVVGDLSFHGVRPTRHIFTGASWLDRQRPAAASPGPTCLRLVDWPEGRDLAQGQWDVIRLVIGPAEEPVAALNVWHSLLAGRVPDVGLEISLLVDETTLGRLPVALWHGARLGPLALMVGVVMPAGGESNPAWPAMAEALWITEVEAKRLKLPFRWLSVPQSTLGQATTQRLPSWELQGPYRWLGAPFRRPGTGHRRAALVF